MNTAAFLFDACGGTLLAGEFGATPSVPYLFETPGDYYLVVKATLPFVTGEYTLTVGECDSNEPNDDCTEATPIVAGVDYLAAIHPGDGEKDWYAFTADADERVVIEVSPVDGAPQLDTALLLWDSCPIGPEALDLQFGPAPTIQYTFPTAGTYYITVAGVLPFQTGFYVLSVGACPVADEATTWGSLKTRF